MKDIVAKNVVSTGAESKDPRSNSAGSKDEPVRKAVEKFVTESIADTDLFLVDIVMRGRHGSRVVEVYLDGDKGVGVDQLAQISRQVAFLLDSEDLIRGKYHLNVSSPGEERVLKYPRQYRKFEGRDIELQIRSENPESVPTTMTGKLLESSEKALKLKLVTGEHRTIPFEEVEKAQIVMPW